MTQYTVGGPEVLEMEDVDRPQPLPTEVLLRVKAVGLNPLEGRLREGEFPLIGPPPFTLGWDVAGVVQGAMTWRFRPGDEVFGLALFPREAAAYAEFVAVPALQLVRKPAALSWAQAAALPIAGLTAWQGLVDLARVRPGDRVLIHGGGGGVGHLAIQIAKAFGAWVATTVSQDKRAFVESLGADQVVDYRQVDFADVVSDIDIVLDTLGGSPAARSFLVLRRGGHFLTAAAEDDPALMRLADETGTRFSGIAVDPDPAGLKGLVTLVEQGRLHVHVQDIFPLDRVVDAHRQLDAGHIQGKLVLTTDM